MILALRCDGPVTTVWLFNRDDVAWSPDLEWESGRSLADELLCRLQDLLGSKGISLAELKGYIIYSGPGSFTSLRIGHTVLNTLGDGYNVPIVGATGEDWIATGLVLLESAQPGVPALPLYGSEANITKSRT